MANSMDGQTWTIHQYGVCQDCGETWEQHKDHAARKAAYAHAKKTGHSVTVETATVTKYNPK